MRHERSVISEAGAEGWSQSVQFARWDSRKVIKHCDGILFWAATVIRMAAMIKLRHQQPSLWHRGLAEDIEGLWEPSMLLVDKLLEDEQLVDTVYEAQGERHPQSRIRGRMQTPAEVLLRLLLLKHIRNWSYDVLERELRANLVYRAFTRIGDEKVPDAKTLARLGQLIGPKVIERLHQRVVELAQERGVTQGRKMRVDTTVVESNIHYPTDSSLLGDGTRVLTRTMKKIEAKSGGSNARCGIACAAYASEFCRLPYRPGCWARPEKSGESGS